ncbi:MAG: DUF1549 domain-containing protein [Pirellulaceae bacterium]
MTQSAFWRLNVIARVLPALAIIACLIIPAIADGQETSPDVDAGVSIPEVQRINEEIRKVWTDYEISPSTRATDGEWCRRVYLDVIGRVPSVEELKEFRSSSDEDKRQKLVNKLLYDEEFTELYANNWTTLWTNVLIGRSGGSEQNSLTNRSGLQKYMRDSLARNKPYDKIAYELVTATGSNTPGMEEFNGAVNFLTMKLEENATQATAETSKIFLGLQVQCTQCHNHPFNEWKQQKFWEMNAFFRQTRALRRFTPGTRDVSGAELVNEDFRGEGISPDPDEADIYYELRNGLTKVAYPVFVDGTDIPKSGYVQDVIRRTELGKLIVESEYLSKMAVNRLWAHFLGYGFTKPIDDMGPHNAATHPELLDYLAKQLVAKSYNLKDVISWIVLSEPYSLSSRTNSTNVTADDPLLGEPPKFSRFYLRQMRAEELYESLLVATQAHKTRGSYEEQEKIKSQWLDQFVTAFGNDDGGEATTFNGTIPQALMLFNGDLVKKATSTRENGFLDTVDKDMNFSNPQKINYMFQAALSRNPTKSEVTIANKLLFARKGDTVAALQDIWWAVLNSNEFIINH